MSKQYSLDHMGMQSAQAEDPEGFKENCIEFSSSNRNARRVAIRVLKKASKKNSKIRELLAAAPKPEGGAA